MNDIYFLNKKAVVNLNKRLSEPLQLQNSPLWEIIEENPHEKSLIAVVDVVTRQQIYFNARVSIFGRMGENHDSVSGFLLWATVKRGYTSIESIFLPDKDKYRWNIMPAVFDLLDRAVTKFREHFNTDPHDNKT